LTDSLLNERNIDYKNYHKETMGKKDEGTTKLFN